jgi:hypothetical protein
MITGAVETPGLEITMAKKITRRGQKQCPKCDAWVKGTRAKTCAKCDHEFGAKPDRATVAEQVVAVSEKPVKPGATMTIGHVKAVAETVKTLGGFDRANELLATIKEVGGAKRFKELLDVMAMTQPTETKK